MKRLLVPDNILRFFVDAFNHSFPDRSKSVNDVVNTFESYEDLLIWDSKQKIDWWKSLDMKDPYLCKIFSGMFGNPEQRIEQLYIIRNTMNFKVK